ncbi:hypothetical protein D3C73_1344720 [compost metagenome]
MQAELALLQGRAQVLQQLQLLTGIAVHGNVEEAVAILAAALGVIHGSIRVAQQLQLVLAITRVQDNAQARRQLQVMLRHAERPRHQVDLFDCHIHGIGGLLQLHKQHKLVAANTRQCVLAVQVAAQACCHCLEQ